MKKLLAFILCLIMIVSLFVSCADSDQTESKAESESVSTTETSKADESSAEESSAAVESPYMDENGVYVAKYLPEFKDEWKDYQTFTVLINNNKVQTTYFNEEIEVLYDTTDEAIREAVAKRNNEIYEKYGIEIKAKAVDSVSSALRTALNDTVDFDLAMPFMNEAAIFASEGVLYDLNDFEGIIDLEAPWWDQNANSSLSIANHNFFATGDISIMQKINTNTIAFNKKLMESYFPDIDIYEIVKSGEWTFDKLYEMSCAFTRSGEVNDGVMDEEDYWGIQNCVLNGLYIGAGQHLVEKDSDDIPVISIGKGDSLIVATALQEKYAEKETWHIEYEDYTNQSWDNVVKSFGEGHVLFYNCYFSAIKKLRAYDVKFGFLPNPKYSEAQDDYCSYCACSSAHATCIPYGVRDAEYSAYMTELLASGAKNTLTPAYYDYALKGKDADDDADVEMLDLIFGNIIYDVAIVYGFNGLNKILTTSTAETLSHDLESNRDSFQDAIDILVDSFGNAG